MYDGSEDLQGLAPAAPEFGRYVAGLAALIASAGVASAEPNDAVTLRPAVTHHGWQLDLSGYVQADSVAWSQDSIDELDPSTGDPLNEQRFLIRRGRLRAETKRDALSASLELDGNTVNGATARILSAHVGYTLVDRGPALVAVSAGLFKTPFGAEVPASERDKPFLEPPAFARALFPGNYDGGVMVHGRYGAARWSLAMMNGALVDDTQWKGKDVSSSYDLVGRLGAAIDGPYRSHVEAGVSAITGKGLHAGNPPTKDELQWVDENQDGIVQTTELQIVPGMTATPSQSFSRNAVGADVSVHWCLCELGTGMAFAEVVAATNLDRGIVYADPIVTDRDLRQLGFSVGVVQNIGEHAQIGARYDRYDADRDASEYEGVVLVGIDKVFSTLSVMATARLNDARLLLQYDRERNPFGRGDDGMPTTRSADRVTVRAQVGF